jgi:arylsulfatase A-like enzyme
MIEKIHFVDQVAAAKTTAPGKNHVAVHPMSLNRETITSLFQHPVSTTEFGPMVVGARAHLQFACGLKPMSWQRVKTEVRFQITAINSSGQKTILFSHSLDPKNRPDDRRWAKQDIDLSAFENTPITLVFSTDVPDGAPTDYCWSGWADPCLIHEVSERRVRPAKEKHRHLLLITADALRADHLGCYGHPTIKTPHLDQLARDGVLFNHARAQTSLTLASYASLLTGQPMSAHGIIGEWGRFPGHVLNLPASLESHGYHSMVALSELELADPEAGFADVFSEQIPCVAQPAQDGSVTTRQFLQRLDRFSDQPCFAWLQFFDTHPPSTPPEPFKSMYYRNDPADPRNAFQREAIAQIRGTEVVYDFMISLPLLEKGVIDDGLVTRLEGAIQFLQGKIAYGPDLGAHLKSLGPEARGGRSMPEFTDWLGRQLQLLREGKIDPDYILWMKKVFPLLRDIESDILSWLEGVVDYRFPISQYHGSVSYLDHLIGQLVEALKERDLYDCTTIVFTSPHGELFGERDVYFHHHLLLEPVLRIPMIIKPGIGCWPKGVVPQSGAKIDGVFDSVDLFPTLHETLGLPVPQALPGVSRWKAVLAGEPIEAHDSFAVDQQKFSCSILSGSYKYIEMMANRSLSSGWQWKKGDRVLFDLRESPPEIHNRIQDHPELAADLGRRLGEWRQVSI